MITSRLRRGRPVAALALVVATAVGLSACGSGSSGSGDPKTVNLVAYSVPKPAYDALTTAFGIDIGGTGTKEIRTLAPQD